MLWKDVIGLEDYFQISDNGLIYSKRTNKILKTVISKTGYELFSTKIGGRQGTDLCLRVHRLVAEAFIPNPENKPTINHIDGNKLNNNVDNLEWATYQENSRHAYDTGLNEGYKGTEHKSSKLTEDDVRYIREHYKPYCRINGTGGLAKKFGVHRCNIGRALREESYKNIK